MDTQQPPTLIDLGEVKRRTGFKATQSIYNKMAHEGLPRPITVGTRTKRWILSEIDAWILARIDESRQAGGV